MIIHHCEDADTSQPNCPDAQNLMIINNVHFFSVLFFINFYSRLFITKSLDSCSQLKLNNHLTYIYLDFLLIKSKRFIYLPIFIFPSLKCKIHKQFKGPIAFALFFPSVSVCICLFVYVICMCVWDIARYIKTVEIKIDFSKFRYSENSYT